MCVFCVKSGDLCGSEGAVARGADWHSDADEIRKKMRMRFHCPYCHSQLAKSQPITCRYCGKDLPENYYYIPWFETFFGKMLLLVCFACFAIPILVLGGYLGAKLAGYFEMDGDFTIIVIQGAAFGLLILFMYLIGKLVSFFLKG